MHLPQPQLERLLGERARELGADVRRGHEVAGVSQDGATVAADVRGPDGPYRVTARYLAGCDGAHSKVRDTAGIGFPGTTYPEVNRLAQVTVPDSVTRLDNGDLDVPGLGRIRAGFTRTDRGVFGFGPLTHGGLLVQTTEDEPADISDDAPMTLTEFQDSIRRVLGADLPLADVTRLSRYGFQARQAARYRDGRILLVGDAAHQFPATGIGINFGMLDAVNLAWKLAAVIAGWASAGLLDSYHDERHFAGARALRQTQAQVALRRGQDRAAEALRELFGELLADEQLPWIADADDATFGEVGEAAKIPVVVDLWAPWCGPCRMVSPALEHLARDLAGKVKLVKVNVDTSPQVSQRFGVQAIPTLLVLRRGQVAARQTGAVPLAALRTWVDNALAAAS